VRVSEDPEVYVLRRWSRAGLAHGVAMALAIATFLDVASKGFSLAEGAYVWTPLDTLLLGGCAAAALAYQWTRGEVIGAVIQGDHLVLRRYEPYRREAFPRHATRVVIPVHDLESVVADRAGPRLILRSRAGVFALRADWDAVLAAEVAVRAWWDAAGHANHRAP
jgi:hypothetical protein